MGWRLNVRARKIPFKSGSGFFAWLEDGSHEEIKAWFFRDMARKHDTVVRTGSRLCITVRSDGTSIRKADPRYGNKQWEIHIGEGTQIETNLFRIGRLPVSGYVE